MPHIVSQKIPARKYISLSIIILLLFSMFSFRFLGRNRKPIYPGEKNLNPGLSSPQGENSGHPPYGGTLVMGASNQPTIINPFLTFQSVSSEVVSLLFDPLVRTDSQGRTIPGLAESWDISADGREYTFHLRTGVTFHDGVELTAEDVKFTYDTAATLSNTSTNQQVMKDFVQEWEVLDPHTIRLLLRKPYRSVLECLGREIAPRHLLAGRDLNSTDFNYAPVGSGPFMFKSWDRQTDEIVLVANPNYFEGRPYLDRVVMKVYADKARLWAGLMKHEVDVMTFMNQADYKAIQQDPAFRAYQIIGKVYLGMAYNTHDPVFYDKDVRRAIAYGVNIDEIIALTDSPGERSVGPFHPGSIGFNPDVQPIPYDPVMARMLLMHRGWWDKDHDGIAEKGGRDLELRLLVYPGIKFQEQVAMVLRQQLARIGVKVSVILQEASDNPTPEFMRESRPQAWLHYFISYSGKDSPFNWFFMSEYRGNIFSYRNAKIDRWVTQAMAEPDEKLRAKLYQRVHKEIYQDQPVCFLFYPVIYNAVSVKFANTDALFSSYMPVYTLKDWYLLQPGAVASMSNGSERFLGQ